MCTTKAKQLPLLTVLLRRAQPPKARPRAPQPPARTVLPRAPHPLLSLLSPPSKPIPGGNVRPRAGSAPSAVNVSFSGSSLSPHHPKPDLTRSHLISYLAYTSLLRITTTPPEKDEHRDSDELDDHVPAVAVAVTPTTTAPQPAAQQERGRFGFLRAFGRSGQPQPDIERGTAPAANAA